MTNKVSPLKAVAFASLGLCAANIASAQQNIDTNQASVTQATQLILKKGQYLSIIMPEAKTTEHARKARQEYYRAAFPLGSKFGLKRETQLKISDTIISEYKPSGVIFFSYPDKQSEAELASHPQWPGIKATRPAIWNELNIFSAELTEDLNITFDPNKSYTLVVAWKKEEDPEGYDKYLKGIEPAVERFGGKFIYKMHNPASETNKPSAKAPSQLTFVEWDSLDGFSKVQASDEYKASVPYFQAGVSKIEFYRMVVPQ